jgi:hypothetical protein
MKRTPTPSASGERNSRRVTSGTTKQDSASPHLLGSVSVRKLTSFETNGVAPDIVVAVYC